MTHQDREERLKRAPSQRRKMDSVLNRFLAIATEILSTQPDRTMPLKDLRDHLQAALDIPTSSVYSYVAGLDELVTRPSPDGSGKLVHLVVDTDDKP